MEFDSRPLGIYSLDHTVLLWVEGGDDRSLGMRRIRVSPEVAG